MSSEVCADTVVVCSCKQTDPWCLNGGYHYLSGCLLAAVESPSSCDLILNMKQRANLPAQLESSGGMWQVDGDRYWNVVREL